VPKDSPQRGVSRSFALFDFRFVHRLGGDGPLGRQVARNLPGPATRIRASSPSGRPRAPNLGGSGVPYSNCGVSLAKKDRAARHCDRPRAPGLSMLTPTPRSVPWMTSSSQSAPSCPGNLSLSGSTATPLRARGATWHPARTEEPRLLHLAGPLLGTKPSLRPRIAVVPKPL
jgi:hypothetical protein